MDGFRYAYSLNGHKRPVLQKFYIPADTAIEQGEPFQYTPGTGVIVHADPATLDDPIVAVAAEAHDGATAGRQSGTEILGFVDPDAVFKYTCEKVYTLTGGSTTTAVDSSLVPQTDKLWIGGAIKIVSCAADSSLNGRVVKISDSKGSTGTLTLAETLPAALAASDTIRICPGILAKTQSWDLDSDAMNPDFDNDGAGGLILVDSSPLEMVSFWKFTVNAFASQPLKLA
jgi:hypothetical protein